MVAKKAFGNLKHLKPFDEVKFVLLDRSDYEFARELVESGKIPASTILFSAVAPANRVSAGLEATALAQWILDDRLNVRLQIQLHKLLWPSRERGV